LIAREGAGPVLEVADNPSLEALALPLLTDLSCEPEQQALVQDNPVLPVRDGKAHHAAW